MSSFDEAFKEVISGKAEGGFNDDPVDHGGATKYGISARFLKSLPEDKLKEYGIKYTDDESLRQIIFDMDIATANKIYKGEFWNGFLFEKLTYQIVTNYYFYIAINFGMAQATKLIQRALWAFYGNMQQVVDDGVFGEKTLSALNNAGSAILAPLRSEVAHCYRAIVDRNPSQEKFLKGWLRRAYG